jgi:hypothetical protein
MGWELRAEELLEIAKNSSAHGNAAVNVARLHMITPSGRWHDVTRRNGAIGRSLLAIVRIQLSSRLWLTGYC